MELTRDKQVSNEQALSDKICGLYCPDCDLAMGKPEDWKCHHGETHVSKYAADLLDSRELAEKQTAIIKEMRETLLAISQKSIAFVCEDVRKMALEQWNKTKDYA